MRVASPERSGLALTRAFSAQKKTLNGRYTEKLKQLLCCIKWPSVRPRKSSAKKCAIIVPPGMIFRVAMRLVQSTKIMYYLVKRGEAHAGR